MPLGQFSVLPIINREAFEQARDQLVLDAEKDWMKLVFTKFQPAFSAAEFERQWKSNAKSIGLLYFYCHASGTQLALGSDDRIDSYSLRIQFYDAKLGKRDWPCLLFLNGCSTATGVPTARFWRLWRGGHRGIHRRGN